MNWYQAVVDQISKFWAAFTRAFVEVFKWISQFYQLYTWAVGVFLGLLVYAITYAWDVIGWLGANLPAFLASLENGGSGIGGQQVPGPLGQAFAVANAILPLTEAFGFVVAIGPIWMIAVTIRIVKSWIPTVN